MQFNLYVNIMFTVYLYLVLILITIFVLYITKYQIIFFYEDKKKKLLNRTTPILQCNKIYFSPSMDQKKYLQNIKTKI